MIEVTDEMVERANRAWFKQHEPDYGWEWRKALYAFGGTDPAIALMRAALEAALDDETPINVNHE